MYLNFKKCIILKKPHIIVTKAQTYDQWRSQKNRRGVSELIVHNIKFNNSHKLKLNNDYITSNLIVLDETSYFESDAKYHQ